MLAQQGRLLYSPFRTKQNPTNQPRNRQMSHYSKFITEATGEKNPLRLIAIEESMRNDVFHSTLDWQSAHQLRQGAIQAVAILAAIQTHYELDAYKEKNARLLEVLTDIEKHLSTGAALHSGSRIFAEDAPALNVIRAALEEAAK
jgi:hypothetical protein